MKFLLSLSLTLGLLNEVLGHANIVNDLNAPAIRNRGFDGPGHGQWPVCRKVTKTTSTTAVEATTTPSTTPLTTPSTTPATTPSTTPSVTTSASTTTSSSAFNFCLGDGGPCESNGDCCEEYYCAPAEIRGGQSECRIRPA